MIRIEPVVVPALPASAPIARESDTSPSEFTMNDPAGVPVTSTFRALDRTTNPPVPSVSVMMPPGPEFPPKAWSLPLLPTVSLWARISKMLAPPKNPPLCSVTSRVPKSNVQLPPAGGVTVTVRLIVHAVAVHDAVQFPPQPAITSAAVHTAAACRAGAASRTSAAATTRARLTGTPPSCRCGTA